MPEFNYELIIYIESKIGELYNEGESLDDIPWDKVWLKLNKNRQKEIRKILGNSDDELIVGRFKHKFLSNKLYDSDRKKFIISKYYDPFVSLRTQFGDQIADFVINLGAKTYLDTFRHYTMISPNDKRVEMAETAFGEKIKSVCVQFPDFNKAFSKFSKASQLWDVFIKHLPKDVGEQLEKLRAVNIQNGKIVAKPIKGSQILTTAMFAREVAKEEVGSTEKSAHRRPKIRQERVNPRAGPKDPSNG